jgi:hypothetical protein
LRSGTLIPNAKGTQTFFMLGAVFFSSQASARERLGLSAIFLGLSVGFMALGALTVPLILYNLYRQAPHRNQFFADASIYTVIALLSCFGWFLPFYEGLLNMVQHRFEAGITVPNHGSVWRLVAGIAPEYWTAIKWSVIAGFGLIHVIGVWQKKLSIEVLTASAFILFVHLFTTDGSMDRLNIALMTCICLYGFTQQSVYGTLLPLYFLGGGLSVVISLLIGASDAVFGYEPFEYSYTDGAFNGIFISVYLYLILKIVRSRRLDVGH